MVREGLEEYYYYPFSSLLACLSSQHCFTSHLQRAGQRRSGDTSHLTPIRPLHYSHAAAALPLRNPVTVARCRCRPRVPFHLGFSRWKVQRSLFPIDQPNFFKRPAPLSPRPKGQEEPGQATPLHSPGSKRTPRAQAHTHTQHTGPRLVARATPGRPRNGAARRFTGK